VQHDAKVTGVQPVDDLLRIGKVAGMPFSCQLSAFSEELRDGFKTPVVPGFSLASAGLQPGLSLA
jgi:hypothetical protein